MRKTRGGFKLGKRLVRCFSRILRQRCRSSGYRRLSQPSTCKSNTISKIFNWGCQLKKRAANGLKLIKPGHGSGSIKPGQEPMLDKNSKAPPKGHLAVYVRQEDADEFRRVLVPVIYFNHPLFGELLREAEEEYGFHHQGGITIPCRISEFERVQMTIAAGCRSCRRVTW